MPIMGWTALELTQFLNIIHKDINMCYTSKRSGRLKL